MTVKGEALVERIIRQLKDANVFDITIVVGHLKEQYEYLIDKYGVHLLYNPDYARKNNLYSLHLVSNRIANTYIVPCDLWFKDNPFSTTEFCSWYGVSDQLDDGRQVRVSRKRESWSLQEKNRQATL